MLCYSAWTRNAWMREEAKETAKKTARRRLYHVAFDHDELWAKRNRQTGTGAEEYIQEEPADRPPTREAGVGAGTGDACGPRTNIVDPQQYTSVGTNAGNKRLRFLIDTLNSMDARFRRSKHQRLFHKAFIGACLLKIMGSDLYRNLGPLLEEFDLDEIRTDVVLYTPRRMGKTMSVALFAAAYLWTQPSCEISIYSPGRRASQKLLAAVAKMVVYLNGGKWDGAIRVKNAETMQVYGTGQYASIIHSYPSKVEICFLFFSFCHHQKRFSKKRPPPSFCFLFFLYLFYSYTGSSRFFHKLDDVISVREN